MGSAVRFDDRLDTVMRRPVAAETAAAQWAQLVDLMAQESDDADQAKTNAAIERLRLLGAHVPLERRRAVATAVGVRCRSAALVEIFAGDDIRIAAPILTGATIDGDSWARLIPAISPAARGLLRGRRDLPQLALQALQAFGPADLVLRDRPDRAEARDPVVSPPVPGTTAISALVARIEQWRSTAAPKPQITEREPAHERFRFETDASGAIQWQDGGRGSALIGLSIADLATPGGFGVDGQAAGAFAKRAPVDGARMRLPDGNWSVDARPVFDPESGRFCGYVGAGRRQEDAQPGFLAGLPHDAARQLIHELGTPLNAIRGFAEMIAGEMLGPLAEGYRYRARSVVHDSRRLGIVVDEIAIAARLDRDVADVQTGDGGAMMPAILARIGEDLSWIQGTRGTTLSLGAMEAAPLAMNEEDAARIVGHLLQTLIGVANRGETLIIDAHLQGGFQQAIVDLPEDLRMLSQEACLGSTISADTANPDGPPVGLGYTFRLIAGMIGRFGGHLRIADGRCILNMPLRADSGGSAKESL